MLFIFSLFGIFLVIENEKLKKENLSLTRTTISLGKEKQDSEENIIFLEKETENLEENMVFLEKENKVLKKELKECNSIKDINKSLREAIELNRNISQNKSEESEGKYILSRKCAIALITTGVSVGAFSGIAISYFLAFIGFGQVGVVAGTWASAWQAHMGIISAGSLFSLLQSIAMAGFSLSGTAILSGSTAVAVAGFCEMIENP
jgi:hypothetical protein